jgi:hypothetical protein
LIAFDGRASHDCLATRKRRPTRDIDFAALELENAAEAVLPAVRKIATPLMPHAVVVGHFAADPTI